MGTWLPTVAVELFAVCEKTEELQKNIQIPIAVRTFFIDKNF
jgi:hypothetical protein